MIKRKGFFALNDMTISKKGDGGNEWGPEIPNVKEVFKTIHSI